MSAPVPSRRSAARVRERQEARVNRRKLLKLSVYLLTDVALPLLVVWIAHTVGWNS